MQNEKEDFVRDGFLKLIKEIKIDAKPVWGKMNPQQMVEHVTAFFKISSDRLKFPLVTPPEHLHKYKEFLMSETPFRENTKAPTVILGDEPLPMRFATMQEAIQALEKSVTEFFDYFKQDISITTLHPVFGELNFDEWIRLHHKHVTHHLKQFGKEIAA